MNYLSVDRLSKSFGDQQLFHDISFGLSRGDKTALVARNGKGKTTLLRMLAGREGCDTGSFSFRKGIRVAFLEQVPDLDASLSIDVLIASAGTASIALIQRYEKALREHAREATSENARMLEELTNAMDQAQAWDYERRLKQLLDLFRITDTTRIVGSLSGGERKRLALALVLLDEPDFLILDEPTNHLDMEMIQWLEDYLARANLTLLMVTHDRYFLDRVCNRILEMHQGALFSYPGNYNYFLEKRAEQEARQEQEAGRAAQLLKQELKWLRRMPKARTHKSKSRIDAIGELEERASLRSDNAQMSLQVKSPRLGGKIMELEGISKAFGSQQILAPFTYHFQRADRLGIIGRNGSGKSTFLNMLMAEEALDSGSIVRGETVVASYYKQMVQEWDPAMRVIDAVKEIAEVVHLKDGRSISAAQFLEHFMFPPDAQYKKIAKLSGGEKRRLHLLSVLIRNPNFLILDEPTNDLDLFALNTLEAFLMGFQGCLIIVSHDRYFLDKLCDHLFVFEGEGRIRDYYGSCSHYFREKSGSTGKPVKVKDKKPAVQKASEAGEKTRLSYKEQREYDQLEPEIEALEKEKTTLEEALGSGQLGYEALEEKSARIAELIALIDEKMARWMELGQYT